MFLSIETLPLILSFNSPCPELLRPDIPLSGCVVPIPTLPSSVITKVEFSSELNWKDCTGFAVNIPILFVLVSTINPSSLFPNDNLDPIVENWM